MLRANVSNPDSLHVRFRFTYEEVKEYYDRCHDLARVRMRFQEMREVLRARFGD